MQSSGAQGPRNCVSCGRSISWDANVCPYCGHDYRVVMAPQPPKKESSMPMAAGILIIIGSLIYMGIGALIAVGSAAILLGEGVVCGIAFLGVGVLALLGGVFALQKRYFALAVIGGVLTIPTVLGLIGLILVAISKEEFTS